MSIASISSDVVEPVEREDLGVQRTGHTMNAFDSFDNESVSLG